MSRTKRVSIGLLFVCAACSSDGKGTATFTTWGEAYIEDGLPFDPTGDAGFTDGWAVKYGKFLVAFHGITVADGTNAVATWTGSKLVDNVKKGVKDLVSFPDLDARAYDRVSYAVKPPAATTELVGATEADRAAMIAKGYALYAEGTATKGGVTKTFRWGFPISTSYTECKQAPAEGKSGKEIEGIVVTEGNATKIELTTHGDHLFYDRLQASDDPALPTRLRFDAIAAADGNGDGEVTMDELAAAPIDIRLYNPSPFPVTTMGAFITSLARTVGHFAGEGECTVRSL